MTLRPCAWKGAVQYHQCVEPPLPSNGSPTGAITGSVVLQWQVQEAERSRKCAEPASELCADRGRPLGRCQVRGRA